MTLEWTTVLIFLDAFAACLWVGRQLTLAGLATTLRSVTPKAPRLAARYPTRQIPGRIAALAALSGLSALSALFLVMVLAG